MKPKQIAFFTNEIDKEQLALIYAVVFEEMQSMRKFILSIFSGYATLQIALLSLLFSNGNSLLPYQITFAIFGLILTTFIYYYFIYSLTELFHEAHISVHRIETIFNAYKKNSDGISLLPSRWTDVTEDKWIDPLLKVAYGGIGVLAVLNFAFLMSFLVCDF